MMRRIRLWIAQIRAAFALMDEYEYRELLEREEAERQAAARRRTEQERRP